MKKLSDDRKRVLSTVSIKSINSTTINSTVATLLPRFDSNRINRKFNQQFRFKQSPIKMSQPTTVFEQQTLKQSTRIVLKNCVFELERLAQVINWQPSRQSEIANMIIELTSLLGQDFDKLEIYLIVLQNKCKSVSNNLWMLFSFVMAIIQESYGHGKSAMQIYKHMCEMANKNQMFRCKLMCYYRLGLIYNRSRQYEKLIVVGKKLLKLSWYYGDGDYESNAYSLIGKGYVGLQDMEMGVTFMNRYLDGVLQKNDHIKHIGIQQISLYHRRTQEPRHRSPSQDDFNLEMFREKVERNYIKMKMVGGKLAFKTQTSECDICDQYGRNHEKIQILDQHPYKRDLIVHTDSRNRDFLGYFDSEQIQQLYIPNKTLPVLRQLLLKFISYI